MRTQRDEVKIFSSTVKLQLAFTAAVATDLFTATAHGLSVNDCLQFTTATTLPAGLSLATNYYVIAVLSVDTFKVSATPNGITVDITDTGTGTHTYHLKGKAINTGDWEINKLSVDMSGTPTMTIKVQSSDSLEPPNFNAAQSASNRWDYVDVIDSQNGASIDGDTGIATAGTADHRTFQINEQGNRWITVVVTAWTDGELGVYLTSYNK